MYPSIVKSVEISIAKFVAKIFEILFLKNCVKCVKLFSSCTKNLQHFYNLQIYTPMLHHSLHKVPKKFCFLLQKLCKVGKKYFFSCAKFLPFSNLHTPMLDHMKSLLVY